MKIATDNVNDVNGRLPVLLRGLDEAGGAVAFFSTDDKR